MSDRSQLRDELANAPEARPDPDPEFSSHRRKDRPKGEVWDGCPVKPLGVRNGVTYYLDVHGQLRAIGKVDRLAIKGLFGHELPQLWRKFPQKGAKGSKPKKRRFDGDDVDQTLIMAAAEKGVFNPHDSVRGVGSWTDDDGRLVTHLGDKVLVGRDERTPGQIGNKIYPAAPPIEPPDFNPRGTDPVPDILNTIETFNWREPDLYPTVALGMICAQILGGALDWRPVFWLLAPAGAGKSEFQRMLKALHGDAGLIQSTDATKSGLTSKIQQSSLPVAVDELEPGDERSTKERDIINLARVAASGGEWFRGSADQTGVGGKVYSTFLFSSILIPGVMKTQDVQRLVRLELDPIKSKGTGLNLDPRVWRGRGARLRAQLIERWDTWPQRLATWRHGLELAKVMGRDADNWATVLALADMAMNDALPSDDAMAAFCQKAAFLNEAAKDDVQNDAGAMLLHLMSQPFDPFRRGQQFNVGQWLAAAADLPGRPDALTLGTDGDTLLSERERQKKANEFLATVGLRVQGHGHEAQIFIGNSPVHGLNKLFEGTQWHNGVWKQSAARVPGATTPKSSLSLATVRMRGHLIPVTSIPGLVSLPADHSRLDGGTATPESDDEEFA